MTTRDQRERCVVCAVGSPLAITAVREVAAQNNATLEPDDWARMGATTALAAVLGHGRSAFESMCEAHQHDVKEAAAHSVGRGQDGN